MHMKEAPKKLCKAMPKERRRWKIKCLQTQENRQNSKCREGKKKEIKQNEENAAHLGLVKRYVTGRES